MSKWDYQKFFAPQKVDIKNGVYTLCVNIHQTDNLDSIVCDFDGIIKINGEIYNATTQKANSKGQCLITFVFTEEYLASCPKKYFASIYRYPECNCCVEEDEIEVESLDPEPYELRKTELRGTFTRHSGTTPKMMCYFSGGIL